MGLQREICALTEVLNLNDKMLSSDLFECVVCGKKDMRWHVKYAVRLPDLTMRGPYCSHECMNSDCEKAAEQIL